MKTTRGERLAAYTPPIGKPELRAIARLDNERPDFGGLKGVMARYQEDCELLVINAGSGERGFPRHLSQHVGGIVITRGRLDELTPLENAAMPGRTVLEWDKDDLDTLGILKVDYLALGMLTAIRKSFELIRLHTGRELTLATIPAEDRSVYNMLCRAELIGVFQVESRARMATIIPLPAWSQEVNSGVLFSDCFCHLVGGSPRRPDRRVRGSHHPVP